MTQAAFVGVDWGTSNARFMLCDGLGAIIAERDGPGIARLDGALAIEAACFAALEGWPRVPVVMSGMVGANIGWKPAPYVGTPAHAAQHRAQAVRFVARGWQFSLLPGVSTTRADGHADRMRGEETQIFGVIGDTSTLVCLPGTHCKWVAVAQGAILAFHTAMTGELLDIVGRHSILLDPRRAPMARADSAFGKGVAAIKDSVLGLETLLFTVRSAQLAGTLRPDAADSYLAGLCIGADVRSALAVHRDPARITLIGAPGLTALYVAALELFGCDAAVVDGRDAVRAGLLAAWQAGGPCS